MFNFKKFMKITLISSAILSVGGGVFAAQSVPIYDCLTPDTPSPQVCFYTGKNYTGNWYCESGERTVNKVNKAPWKNNIESIKLIDGASVKIYNHYNRDGSYILLEKSNKQLDSDFFNKVKSYRTIEPESEEYTIPIWCYT